MLRVLLALTVAGLSACQRAPAPQPDRAERPTDALPTGDWTFLPVDGSVCRDGSPTGIGVRPGADGANLLVYLEMGGACYNAATCARNPSAFGAGDFAAWREARGDAGLFSTARRNPVGEWTHVYVPYCTGDVHGGTRPGVAVPGVGGEQQFVGHRNLERALDRLAPMLGPPDTLVLAGASAGAFGTLVNFPEVVDRYPEATAVLFNDSGPAFFDDAVLSPALGRTFADLYGFRDAFPRDARALFEPDGLQGVYAYLADRHPDARFGLASTHRDRTIRYYFGFGQPDGAITGPEYAAGLDDLRERLPEAWRTAYLPGEGHTFVGSDRLFYGGATDLGAWLGSLIAGRAPHVGP